MNYQIELLNVKLRQITFQKNNEMFLFNRPVDYFISFCKYKL